MSVSLIKAGGYGTAGARLPLVAVINPALIVVVSAAVGAVGGVWYFSQVVTLKKKSKAPAAAVG